MNTKVNITPLTLYAQHERGKTLLFNNERTGEFILGYRVKDSISGRHYHKGNAANKNPEILILISGSIQLKTIELDTKNEQAVIVDVPSRIEIAAMVWHEVLALTDCVFLEMNSIKDCEDDTHKLEQTA
jgi:hypothetical protein